MLKPLTLPEAAEQWIASTEAIAQHKALIAQAEPVLEAYFKRSGRTYRDRIAYEQTGGSLVLDQPKVKAFLGAKLKDFQKRSALGWKLKLLG